MSDPCRLATEYAMRIAGTNNLDDLRRIWEEINLNIESVKGWYQWLVDIKDSRKYILEAPDIKPEDVLNKSGLKALREGKI